jgi:hypothetical protein
MADTEAIINQAIQTGGAPNISDAYTINGLPGPLYNCSAQGTVLRGNTKILLLTCSKIYLFLNIRHKHDELTSIFSR